MEFSHDSPWLIDFQVGELVNLPWSVILFCFFKFLLFWPGCGLKSWNSFRCSWNSKWSWRTKWHFKEHLPKSLVALTVVFPVYGNLAAIVHTLVASFLDKWGIWLCIHCIFIEATDWLPINYQTNFMILCLTKSALENQGTGYLTFCFCLYRAGWLLRWSEEVLLCIQYYNWPIVILLLFIVGHSL